MASEERDLFDIDDDRPWPSPHHHWRFTSGCPECDATRFMLTAEYDLRTASLDLWVAGWTPGELIDEVRRVTGRPLAADLTALALIVDDSHRSPQARPDKWIAEIGMLRTTTGFDDVHPGWLARWAVTQSEPSVASSTVLAVVRVLDDLLDPTAAA